MNLKKDVETIFLKALESQFPENAVIENLEKIRLSKKIFILAVGKAAFRMAKSAREYLGESVCGGVVITKYGHSEGKIENLDIFEAGHPIPDENGIKATDFALQKIEKLKCDVEILFLISGGGSALFEKPLAGVTLEDLIFINNSLLRCGANIVQINTIRKHLSSVKGGRFAHLNKNRNILSLILSDVLGNNLDFIASGPSVADTSTSKQCFDIVERFNLSPENRILEVLKNETPKNVENSKNIVIGSIDGLIRTARKEAKLLGYFPIVLSSNITIDAKETGELFAEIGRDFPSFNEKLLPVAIIGGGETTVRVRGNGIGGRCQEMCLAFLNRVRNENSMRNFSFLSCGSDGTDGPTDAAGGIISNDTVKIVNKKNIDSNIFLNNNDSYSLLNEIDALVKTGPTGTNVNDIHILLIK